MRLREFRVLRVEPLESRRLLAGDPFLLDALAESIPEFSLSPTRDGQQLQLIDRRAATEIMSHLGESSAEASAGQVISFVDSGRADYETLVSEIWAESGSALRPSGNEVIVLEAGRDGIQQITETPLTLTEERLSKAN